MRPMSRSEQRGAALATALAAYSAILRSAAGRHFDRFEGDQSGDGARRTRFISTADERADATPSSLLGISHRRFIRHFRCLISTLLRAAMIIYFMPLI